MHQMAEKPWSLVTTLSGDVLSGRLTQSPDVLRGFLFGNVRAQNIWFSVESSPQCIN